MSGIVESLCLSFMICFVDGLFNEVLFIPYVTRSYSLLFYYDYSLFTWLHIPVWAHLDWFKN